MKNSENTEVKSSLSFCILALCLLVFVYLFSTGPVTRWFPEAADKIYAPLSWIAKNKDLGRLFRDWLHLWGVQ